MDGLLGNITTLLTHDLEFLESTRPHHSSGNMLNVISSNADLGLALTINVETLLTVVV